MLESIKVLWDIFNEKKKDIVKQNQSGLFTKEHLVAVLEWKVLDPTTDKYRPKHNTAINLSVKTLIEKIGISKEEFENKKILDIWCWFTWLPFLLKDLNVELTIVDPIFSSNIIYEIERNKSQLFNLFDEFNQHNYNAYKKWEKDRQSYYYNLNYEFNNIYSDLLNWEKQSKLKEDNKKNFNLLPIPAENITTIEKKSIDIVFINHTITKLQIDSHKVLNKIYELLKHWWKLYITESWDINYDNFKKVNKDFNLEIKRLSNNWYDKKTVLILEKR